MKNKNNREKFLLMIKRSLNMIHKANHNKRNYKWNNYKNLSTHKKKVDHQQFNNFNKMFMTFKNKDFPSHFLSSQSTMLNIKKL